ncbi:hypothetical protein AMS60_21265 [Bacillus sp. FJAT-21945]|nr:hypothetical protein AMS60_21265 [Bacillus sp. FJAT-21945]
MVDGNLLDAPTHKSADSIRLVIMQMSVRICAISGRVFGGVIQGDGTNAQRGGICVDIRVC